MWFSCSLGVLVVLLAAPGLAQPVPRESVVATVAGVADVTMGELNERAERIFYRGVLDRTERYRLAMREATLDVLKGEDFFRMGYDKDPAFLASLGPQLAEEVLIAYYERQYEHPYLNEETIRAQHEAMGRAVTYRRIVLRKPAGATPAVLDALRSTVETIRRQSDAGVPAATLVQRYSEEDLSVNEGGLMPPVTWEQATRSPLDAAVFQLDHGDAVSLETPDAFVIAIGERVDERPVPPLASVHERIVETLRGHYAEQANQAYYEERQALVDSASVRWNDEVLREIVEWARAPGFFRDTYPGVVGAYLAEHGDAVVFTDRAGELRLRDLPRLLGEVLTVRNSDSNRSRAFVQDFLLEAVRADRMLDRADALGIREALLRPGTPSPVLASAFVEFYDQKRIEARLPEPTDAALRAFYQTHVDSLFYQLATVYTEVIERTSEAEIDEAWARVQEGVPFDEVSSRRLVRSFERTRDGEIVSRFLQEPPYLGDVAFGLREGDVAGPVAYDTPEGRRYAIVKATQRLDERPLTYDEVRDRVAEAFTEEHRQRLAAEVEAELRARYEVEVDEAFWARVLDRTP